MFCCMSDSKIAPQENMIMIDKKKADKYGISIERYYKLLGYPNMTRELIDFLHRNGWNFTDTSNDLSLFAEIQTYSDNDVIDDMDITEYGF